MFNYLIYFLDLFFLSSWSKQNLPVPDQHTTPTFLFRNWLP